MAVRKKAGASRKLRLECTVADHRQEPGQCGTALPALFISAGAGRTGAAKNADCSHGALGSQNGASAGKKNTALTSYNQSAGRLLHHIVVCTTPGHYNPGPY